MRHDQVFTPACIVTKMLDMLEYKGDNIKTKTIFEPSFGGGAFLTQIVERIFEYSEINHLTSEETIKILNNVHGVEIDPKWYEKTLETLTVMCESRDIEYDWSNNLICADTTKVYGQFAEQYNYVIFNPPYVKCWDLSKEDRERIEREFEFCQGNTDLYIVFFELCMKALKSDGKLCAITPNSFLRNSSQKQFRKYLSENKLVESIIDYGNVPVFGKVATYTAITILDMAGGHNETKYVMMKNIEEEAWTNTVKLTTIGEKPWSIASSSDDKFLKEIAARKTKLSDLCDIQYGLATNADKVYLVNADDVDQFEKDILRPVIKGSTLASDDFIIFPYEFDDETKKFAMIDEERLRNDFPKTYTHLLANREKLEARDVENGAVWYQYGRSQGIQNSRKPKIALKHVVANDDKQCSLTLGSIDTLVYSGMFITVKNEDDMLTVMRTLMSEEFCRYVKLVGKNMAGGYKSFNTAAVKNFGIKENEE